MDSNFVVYGKERFLTGKSAGEIKRTGVQLENLVKYLTSDIDYRNKVFHLVHPGLPDCPDCPKCSHSTELLGGHLGAKNDLTYFIRCEEESSHLFIIRIVKPVAAY